MRSDVNHPQLFDINTSYGTLAGSILTLPGNGSIAIIGIGCAAQGRKTGLARAYLDRNRPHIQEVTVGDRVDLVVTTVAQRTRY